MNTIRWFSTERQAEQAKNRLRGSKLKKWVVQGNALVKILRKRKL